jgi:putative ABC transport system ATP-binding protein
MNDPGISSDRTSAALSDEAIVLDRLRFRWQAEDPDVLDIAGLSVRRGERLFIEGPSGSGKTTLLNLLAGVVTPRSGSVSVLGTDLGSLGGSQRDSFRADHVGFVFQMFNLIPYLSLVENVTLPLRFSARRRGRARDNGGEAPAPARRLLKQLGLDVDALARRAVTRLSVGQQQRVAVARALIGRPEIVICDEPTSALDADARRAFLDLLSKEVEAAAATLVYVSHDRSLEGFFDRTVKLHEINGAAEGSGGGS